MNTAFISPQLYQIYQVKNVNKHALLELVRFATGGISRADLARKMGLSRAAISSIVNDLLTTGILRETQREATSSGRPPINLEINPRRGYVVGIDIGVTHMLMGVADFSAQVLHEINIPFSIEQGPESGLALVDKTLMALLSQAGIMIDSVLAIGVGVPGPVVAEKGAVSEPPVMPGWHNYPIRDHLESLWNCPVSLNNDAEMGALGEGAYGAGRGEDHLAYIKVGSGIGSGFLLNGRIYCGVSGSAGEIGHITVDPQGPVCTCGNRGCLEVFSGGQAIAQLAQEAMRLNGRTQLSSLASIDQITAKDVALAAQRGDLLAQQILTRAGAHLGTAVANLINLLNPGMVVIGGGVSQIGDLFLEPIRKAVNERSLQAAVQNVRITAAVLGQRSSLMGSVAQAITISLHQLAETQ
ncbi:MAG: ROK family transcriptional regulator [Chloroflexota bacterium]